LLDFLAVLEFLLLKTSFLSKAEISCRIKTYALIRTSYKCTKNCFKGRKLDKRLKKSSKKLGFGAILLNYFYQHVLKSNHLALNLLESIDPDVPEEFVE
jgi:hypothetical protein